LGHAGTTRCFLRHQAFSSSIYKVHQVNFQACHHDECHFGSLIYPLGTLFVAQGKNRYLEYLCISMMRRAPRKATLTTPTLIGTKTDGSLALFSRQDRSVKATTAAAELHVHQTCSCRDHALCFHSLLLCDGHVSETAVIGFNTLLLHK
jgi:hypothetical protein